jgi:4-diphosphocytidyl-2-C-methyl-D-erythritol kinase
MNAITIEAPAKINLLLNIKGKRNDGYHELETVMHQISLADRIHIQPAADISMSSSSRQIPHDSGNLAYQAAELILQTYGSGQGAAIYIDKNIPVGAGLAGGSTDAAAVLKGINILYNYNIPREELAHMAARIGSDVPFCLEGHPVIISDADAGQESSIDYQVRGATSLARGRGERLSPLPERYLPWMVLVKPEYQLSTAEVYGRFKPGQSAGGPDVQAFIKAWEIYDIIGISHQCENILESVSAVLCPEILHIKFRLEELGALKAIMSGSGPSVWGIFEHSETAEKAHNIMKQDYPEAYRISSYGKGG